MDTTRLILIMALVLLGFQLYQAWQLDYGTPAPEPALSVPAATGGVPQQGPVASAPQRPNPEPALPPTADPPLTLQQQRSRIFVETDIFQLEIDTRSGGIHRVGLKKFPVSLDQQEIPLILLDDTPDLFFVIQSMLRSSSQAVPDQYQSAAQNYTLADGKDALEVPMRWENGGIRITRTYSFERGSHLIRLRQVIENQGQENWHGDSYTELRRNDPGRTSRFGIYTYTGAVLSSPDNRYQKISFDDIEDQKMDQEIVNGWAAMIQHYFVAAVVPNEKDKPYRYYTRKTPDSRYAIGVIMPPITVAPGGSAQLEEQIYIGPKVQKTMREIAEGLDLTVDYGWLWFLSKPLFSCLQWLHGLTGNWGWAIILVTIFLKLLFFPLSAAGYKSMARMRRIQPRIMALRDRYQNDKARLNKAMMDIYKEEKINPFGGCLPILVQIPVFIALYWVLLESVEMRQAPFIFWIRDLSVMDPFYILPLLMGISMFIQQKLNPAPPDPVQAKVMQILPVVFTVFFAFFPAGLVLYWVFSNILSIAQQWQITRSLERAGLAPASK